MAEPTTPTPDPADEREVYVVDRVGRRGAIPESQLDDALKQGFTLEPLDATVHAKREKEFGGRGFDAFAQGAARSLTGGLSDVGLGALGLGDDTRQVKEFNEGSALTGEIGGALLPVGMGGLASKAGKAASALVKGEGAAAKIGASALGMGTEGAVFGVGQGISEAALDESPATAEHVISTIGSDILYGGAFGAGLGGVGSALAQGAKAAKAKAGAALGKMAKAEEDAAKAAAWADLPEEYAKMDRPTLAKAEADEVARLRKEADAKIPGDHVHRLDRTELNTARKTAEEEARKEILAGGQGVLDNLDSYIEDVRPSFAKGTRKTTDESGAILARPGDTIPGPRPDFDPKMKANRRKAGDTLVDVGEQGDTIVGGRRPAMLGETMVDGARRAPDSVFVEAAAENADDVMIGGLGKSKKRLMQSLDDRKGWLESPYGALKTRGELRKQEQILKGALNNPRLNLDADNRAIVETWLAKNQQIQDEVSVFYQRAHKPTSPRLEELDGAIASYSDRLAASKERPTSEALNWIDAAKDSFSDRAAMAREAAKPGFVQKLAQSVGGGMAASGLMAMGVPAIGAFPAGFAVAEAGVEAFLGRFGRKLARDGATSREGARKGVEGFFKSAARAGRVGMSTLPIASQVLKKASFATPEQVAESPGRAVKFSKNPRIKAFQERARELDAVAPPGPTGKPQMSPKAQLQLVDRLTGVGALSPALHDEMIMVATRRLEFLASKLPRRNGGALPPIGPDAWHPSEYEIAEFSRYVDAVESPAGVLARMNAGKMTSEDAEALRTVYPEIYGEIQTQIMTKLPELREQLPFEKRLMLSIWFDKPVDASMEPETMKLLQGNYSDEPGTKGGSAPAPSNFTSLRGNNAPTPTPSQERGGAI